MRAVSYRGPLKSVATATKSDQGELARWHFRNGGLVFDSNRIYFAPDDMQVSKDLQMMVDNMVMQGRWMAGVEVRDTSPLDNRGAISEP
jgi:hypothetical protein